MSDVRAFSRWLLRRPAADAAARVFCLPYSGVGASLFNRWPRWIGPAGRVEVCPVQLPGRENRLREPHFGTYPELADRLAAALAPLLDRPAVLFGHCSAALPAFETALRLADAPVPSALVVSAQAPPHRCPHDRFLELTDAELTTELADVVTAMGGTADPALLDLTLRVLHRDLAATRAYHRPRRRLRAGVTVVSWTQDHEVGPELLDEWRDYADDVRFAALPGGHHEFLAGSAGLLDLLAARATPVTAQGGAR